MTKAEHAGSPNITERKRVLIFGSADTTKPRVRLLLEGLQREGHEVIFCTRSVWSGVGDKSQIRGWQSYLWLAFQWFLSMLLLSVRYMFAAPHDIVLVCYPGHLDLWFIRPLSWLRRKPLCWDAFLSAYDTVVLDRAMAKPTSLVGRLAYLMDWCACRLCDRLFLDTPSHASFFMNTFKLAPEKVGFVLVGAEDIFTRAQHKTDHSGGDTVFSVLFYGQLIPLHGIATILEAVRLLDRADIKITLVGRGQLSPLVDDWIATHGSETVRYMPWVAYDTLPDLIQKHDICLGIFSANDKANRVIPNKVYQTLAMGKPLITRTSTAMMDFLGTETAGVIMIPPEDPQALKAALIEAQSNRQSNSLMPPAPALKVEAATVGAQLSSELANTIDRKRRK